MKFLAWNWNLNQTQIQLSRRLKDLIHAEILKDIVEAKKLYLILFTTSRQNFFSRIHRVEKMFSKVSDELCEKFKANAKKK